MQLNSITSPAVIAETTVRVAVVVDREVPMMMSAGWVWSEAEQCQPFEAVSPPPIVITVDPLVKVAVVNCPAVAPPSNVVSSKPPLEVNSVGLLAGLKTAMLAATTLAPAQLHVGFIAPVLGAYK